MLTALAAGHDVDEAAWKVRLGRTGVLDLLRDLGRDLEVPVERLDTARIVGAAYRSGILPVPPQRGPALAVSASEAQLVPYIAAGLPVEELAAITGRALNEVRADCRTLMVKTGARQPTHLITHLYQRGLHRPDRQARIASRAGAGQ
ncbi:hypothetical protein [Streptomyces sp. NPDC007083]|uniref:hypothetical protein n=1 Tax=Streptomyces sp. NPDC007083 TaxID=3156913 RepID=UPI003400D38F